MQTLKNRKRKFALSVKIIAMLSCLAIASVGFASWLVVHDPNAKDVGGQVNVALTSAAELTLSATAKEADLSVGNVAKAKFSFGRPTTKTVDIKWLVPQDVDVEDLLEEYSIGYTPSNLPTGTKAKFTLTFAGVVSGGDGNARIAELIADEYLTLTVTFGGVSKTYNKTNAFPAGGAVLEHSLDAAALAAAGTIDLTIQFAWGEKFGNKNPYEYYNGLPHTAGNVTEALTTLKLLAAIVKGTGDYQVAGADAPLSYNVNIDAELDLSGVQYPTN